MKVIFNTYFTNIADKMPINNSVARNFVINYLYKVFIRPFPRINLTPVTTKGISDIFKSLKLKNSHGYDEIKVRILKISLPYIISALTYICNRSLSTGTFPTRLKYSQINPVFKKGNKTDISNYRPISLHRFRRFSKRLFLIDCIITLMTTTY
jgi:hypothetical protein